MARLVEPKTMFGLLKALLVTPPRRRPRRGAMDADHNGILVELIDGASVGHRCATPGVAGAPVADVWSSVHRSGTVTFTNGQSLVVKTPSHVKFRYR